MAMSIQLKGWTQDAIDKARMLELMQLFTSLAALHCPELLQYTIPCMNRLAPVRLSAGGRQLRAWGREYVFTAEEADHARKLVKGFRNRTPKVVLGEGALQGHQALTDGLIKKSGGLYWLDEPEDQKAKPRLVQFVNAEPVEVLSKQARALALLMEHPEWSDTRIASEVPCSRTTLYDFEKYTAARELLGKGRDKFSESNRRAKPQDGDE